MLVVSQMAASAPPFCRRRLLLSLSLHVYRMERQGFESSARGLRLETIAANVKSSEDFGYMWNADVPCEKEGTPFDYIHEVTRSRCLGRLLHTRENLAIHCRSQIWSE